MSDAINSAAQEIMNLLDSSIRVLSWAGVYSY